LEKLQVLKATPLSPLSRGETSKLQLRGEFHFFYRKSNALWLPPLNGKESNAFEDQTVELGKRGMEIAEMGKNNYF
jgi:hypothetical protein